MFASSSSAAPAGRRIIFEADEREWKLGQIVDMLVAAGYFRARIPALSAFDKLVGGIVWAIVGSSVELDVNLDFREGSAIKQRLPLCESVVKSLLSMGCPHLIEPFVLMDMTNLDTVFPVVQWLIGKVMEHRAATGDVTRRRSRFDFASKYSQSVLASMQKTSSSPADAQAARSLAPTRLTGDAVAEPPKRAFRKAKGAKLDPEKHVVATLLEYDDVSIRQRLGAGSGAGDAAAAAAAAGSSTDGRSAAAALGSGLVSPPRGRRGGAPGASAASGGDADSSSPAAEDFDVESSLQRSTGKAQLSGKLLTGFMDAQSEQIRLENAAFAEAKQASKSRVLTKAQQEKRAHERAVEKLRRAIEQEQTRLETALGESREWDAKIADAKAQVARADDEHAQLEQLLQTSEAEATSTEASHKGALAQLQELVQQNETLKKQRVEFRKTCQARAKELELEIAQAKGEAAQDDAEMARLKEIERVSEKDAAKLAALRAEHAKLAQKIAKATRQIDEVPTRAELVQYEKRFVELYDLLAFKLKEARRFVETYNTLNRVHGFMKKQITLLKSIQDGFEAISRSPDARARFLTSFGSIVEGLKGSVGQVEQLLAEQQQALEALQQQQNALLTGQRKYFARVKEFQDECLLNDKLQKAMQIVQSRAGGAAAADA